MGFKPPEQEIPCYKWLLLNNLGSKALEEIQNLGPRRLMSRLKSKTLQATLFKFGHTPDVWIQKGW